MVRSAWHEAEALRSEFETTISAVADAISSVARGGSNPDALVEAFHDLDRLVTSWTAVHPRPRRNRARIIGDSLTAVQQACELYVEALEAPTPVESQAIALRADAAFINASTRLSQLDEYRRYSGIDEEDPVDFIEQLMLSNRADEPDTLGSLESASRRRHKLSAGATKGSAVELDLYRPIVVLALDEERVERNARLVEQALSDDAALRKLVASPSWREEHSRVSAMLSSTLTSVFHRLDRSADLEAADKLLNLVLKLKEGHARHLLATMLQTRGRDYDECRKQKTGLTFKAASEAFPELELDALNRLLRNAAGHADFNVEGSDITIFDGGKVHRFPSDEFLNDVLEYLELSIVLQIGLTRASAELGIDLPRSHHLGAEQEKIAVASVLAVLGFSSVRVQELAPVARLTLAGKLEDVTKAAFAIRDLMPNTVDRLVIEVTADGTRHVCETDLEALRTVDLSGDVHTVSGALQLAKATAAHRIDGGSGVPSERWVELAHAVARDQCANSVARLRALQNLRAMVTPLQLVAVEHVIRSLQATLRADLAPKVTSTSAFHATSALPTESGLPAWSAINPRYTRDHGSQARSGR